MPANPTLPLTPVVPYLNGVPVPMASGMPDGPIESGNERPAKRRQTTRGRYAAGGITGTELKYISLRSGRKIRADTTRKDQKDGTEERGAFSLFSQLPPELRVQIWRLAAEEASQPFHPLRVRLYRGTERTARGERRGRTQVLRLTAMPDLVLVTKPRRNLLRVSAEARGEVKKLWNRSVQLGRGRVLHFSHEHDIVYLDVVDRAVHTALRTHREQGNLPDFVHAIGHVGFDMTPAYPRWMMSPYEDVLPSYELIFCFPNLHSLSLIKFCPFTTEITWTRRRDVRWLLSRSLSHGVQFRGFSALTDFDYCQAPRSGNHQSTSHYMHECTICTIHKCVYLRQLLQRRKQPPFALQPLTDDEVTFLRRIKRYTLLAATPAMTNCLPSYVTTTNSLWSRAGRVASKDGHGDGLRDNISDEDDEGHALRDAADFEDEDDEDEDEDDEEDDEDDEDDVDDEDEDEDEDE